MIVLGKPGIEQNDSFAIMRNSIEIDGKKENLWFKVRPQYSAYLCSERDDAYLIAVLRYAMLGGHDIECKAPITEELFYNIQEILIPALSSNDPSLKPIKIIGEISSEKISCAEAVGTGISCGVDSFHVLANNTNTKYPHHNVTHLAFNNVGSHGTGEEARRLYEGRLERARSFAEEYGFNLVESDSNLAEVIVQSHYLSHTYSSMFAVYCLQKLYSVYYYASEGYTYDEFLIKNSSQDNPGRYAILSLSLLSISSLKIYSEGEGLDRYEKLKEVIHYTPSYKYLDVCINKVNNCGKCEKCLRTMLGLDVLGALNNYRHVFDIDYYSSHQREYMMQLLYWHRKKPYYYKEIYAHFSKGIPLSYKMLSSLMTLSEDVGRNIKSVLGMLLPDAAKLKLQTLYRKVLSFEY